MLERNNFIIVKYNEDDKQEILVVQEEKVIHHKKVALSRLKTVLQKMRKDYNIRTILLSGNLKYTRELRKELLEYFDEIIDYIRILN